MIRPVALAAFVGAAIMVGAGLTQAAAPQEPSAQTSRLYLSIALGSWRTGGNAVVEPNDGGFSGTLKIGYQKNRHIGFELEAITNFTDYSGPPIPDDPLTFTTFRTSRMLDVGGIALSVRGMAPAGRLQPYAQAGFGIFKSKMEVDGMAIILIFPFVPTQIKESNVDPAFLSAGGLNVQLTKNYFLGAEVRRIWLTESFSRLSGGSIEVGGTAVLLVFGRLFDAAAPFTRRPL